MRKLLLVEDQAVLALAESQTLGKHGYEVITVYSGEAAVKAVELDPEVSLILMDIDLGTGIDGTEAARRILEKQEIPIVFLTNHSEKEYVDRVKKITGYGYVLKNAGEFVLIESIRMAFQLFDAHANLKKENEARKTSEEQLRENEDRLRIINELTSDYAYCHRLTEDGRLQPVWHIGSFDHVTGYTPEELYQKGGWGALIHPEDIPGAREYVETLLSGKASSFTARIVTKDGTIRWIRDTGRPWRDEETGKILGTFGSARDVTERTRAELALQKSEQKYKTLYENVPIPYQSLDAKGCFLDVNPAWLTCLGGYEHEEVIGKPFSDFLHPDGMEDFIKNLKEFKETGTAENNLYKMRKKNGDYIEVSFQGQVAYTPEGEFLRTHCVFENITEKKKTEEALRHSKEELSAIYTHAPILMILVDEERRIRKANAFAEGFTGTPAEKLMEVRAGEALRCIHHLDDPAGCGFGPHCAECTIRNTIRETFRTGKDHTRVNALLPVEEDGKIRHISFLITTSLLKQDGKTLCLVSFQENKPQFHALLEAMTEGVCLHQLLFDEDGRSVNYRILDVNRAYEKILGLKREEVIGKLATETYGSPEPPYLDVYTKVDHTGEPHRFESYFEPMGRHFLISVFSMGDNRFATIFIDISRQKRNEADLEKTGEQLNRMLQILPEGFVTVDQNGEITFANDAAGHILGVYKDKITGEYYNDRKWRQIDEEGNPLPLEKLPLAVTLEKKKPLRSMVHGIITQEGEKKWLSVNTAPLFDPRGSLTGAIASFRDVSKIREAERSLQQSEEKFRALAESVGAIIWEYDIQADLWTYIAPQSQDLLGYSPSEWTDLKFWADRIHEEDRAWATEYCDRCTRQGKSHVFEYRFEKKNGEFLWLQDNVAVELIEGSPVRLRGFMIDITKAKEAEAKLHKALEEKDFLMKELNHRVKNNLTIVSSLINLRSSDGRKDLSDLKSRIKAISLIHEKLYQQENQTEIRVNEYIRDLLGGIFTSLSSRKVAIDTDIDDITMPLKPAVSLGLIINEVGTNAIKHGFSPAEEARFSLGLKKDPRDSLHILTLSNSGKPFPEEIGLIDSPSLGLRLITTLVSELNGSIELQKKPFPVFTIRFRIEDTSDV